MKTPGNRRWSCRTAARVYTAATLTCISLMFAVIPSSAQQDDSLEVYLNQAALNNPGLKSKYLEYMAALEKMPQVGSLPDPSLTFGFFVQPMELVEGRQLADFKLMQMFPWFGTLKASKDEASRMANAKYQEFAAARNQVFFEVKNSFYQLFRTHKEISSLEQDLVLLNEVEKLALVRFKYGSASDGGSTPMNQPASTGDKSGQATQGAGGMNAMGAGTSPGEAANSRSGSSPSSSMGSSGGSGLVDILRIQMERGSLENLIALRKDQLATDRARFNKFLNRSDTATVFIPDTLRPAPLPEGFASIGDSIARNNPMISMYEAEKTAWEANLKMTGRMRYPMLGVGLDYMLIQKSAGSMSNMNGKDMFMPMVSLSLPIYQKKYSAMAREAEFMRDAASANAGNAANELKVQLREATQAYNDAVRREKLYASQSDLARRSITLLTKSYSTGTTDLAEVLRMQQQWLDFQFQFIQGTVDRNTAVALFEMLMAKQ